jgi:hypothetical protein
VPIQERSNQADDDSIVDGRTQWRCVSCDGKLVGRVNKLLWLQRAHDRDASWKQGRRNRNTARDMTEAGSAP